MQMNKSLDGHFILRSLHAIIFTSLKQSFNEALDFCNHSYTHKGSLTVWALYAYFSDSQNAAFELLVWCM